MPSEHARHFVLDPEIVFLNHGSFGACPRAVLEKQSELRLRMERERFQVAYVGGVFAAGDLLLDPLREEIERVAPKAFLAPARRPPAIAAARMAREHLHRLPVAV